jgi:hypothetical protein
VGEVERYLPARPRFVASSIPQLNVDILARIFDSAVAGRDGISFQPIFSFLYKDGHEMLTMGGMLVTRQEQGLLQGLRSQVQNEKWYLRFSWKEPPCKIVVPHLTRKERIFLEGSMPAAKGWTPKSFELSEDDVEAYRRIYRFYPVYAELFF